MKRMIIICLSIVTALIAAKLPEGSGSLSGTVIDKETKEAIIGASVLIEGTDIGAVSDLDGKFSIKAIPVGEYEVSVSSIGYETYRETIKIEVDKEYRLEVSMETSSASMEAVVVSSKRAKAKSADMAVSVEVLGPSGAIDMGSARGARGPETTSGFVVVSASKYESKAAEETGFKDLSGDEGMLMDKMSESVVSEDYLDLRAAEMERAAEELEAEEFHKVKPTKLAPREPKSTAGLLTAANWTDNKNWKFYEDLMKKDEWSKKQEHWGFNMNERIPVKVLSKKQAIVDAQVVLKDASGKTLWEARTDVNGEAFLFANAFGKKQKPTHVEVTVDGNTLKQEIKRLGSLVEIDMPLASKTPRNLDIMFMIDATGSMGDELSYIQSELTDVIKRVKIANEQVASISVSCNVYRDEGDDYVVRSFPFRQNVSLALQDLNDQRAGGGGDYEEAVEQAYADAVNNHKWSKDATARLMFFVLDAPPHHTEANLKKLKEVTIDAAKKGIRVIPIASSGVDKDTEFLMRFLSISTGGTYIFLTDDSGIGNSHIEPTIGKYDVKLLNNLLVEVINSYLNEGAILSKK